MSAPGLQQWALTFRARIGLQQGRWRSVSKAVKALAVLAPHSPQVGWCTRQQHTQTSHTCLAACLGMAACEARLPPLYPLQQPIAACWQPVSSPLSSRTSHASVSTVH